MLPLPVSSDRSTARPGLLALLLRFYEPCKGQVTFGGRDSRSIPLDELRSRCAYVSQDPQLFEGTIRWNLCRRSPSGSSHPSERRLTSYLFFQSAPCNLTKSHKKRSRRPVTRLASSTLFEVSRMALKPRSV